MANKRYWLKIKENFFDDDEIVFLKSQKNGYEYIYLWQRLLLKCLKSHDEKECGFLRINDKVPYNPDMLANLFGMNIDIVRTGIELFIKMGMLDILDDGTFYIEAVQKMIGKESDSAERVRLHRERKLLLCNTDVTNCNDNININTNKEKEEEENNTSFATFWNLYDKKVSKTKTEIQWSKIKPELHNIIFDYVSKYKIAQPDKQFRKNPDVFLRNKCWNDEIITTWNNTKADKLLPGEIPNRSKTISSKDIQI